MQSLALGLSLGLGAGLAPGPLLALVVRSTLQHGFGAGARVALSPLVTDVPIILVAVLLASGLPEAVLGALGIAGGCDGSAGEAALFLLAFYLLLVGTKVAVAAALGAGRSGCCRAAATRSRCAARGCCCS